MIFEIINPSDQYTLEANSFEVACVANLILSEGAYGLKQLDGDLQMPIFLFGGHDEWFTEQFGVSVAGLKEKLTEEFLQQVVVCLKSVMIGGCKERKTYHDALSLIDGEDKKREWRDKWHDNYRGSLNNIGGRAWELADRIKI